MNLGQKQQEENLKCFNEILLKGRKLNFGFNLGIIVKVIAKLCGTQSVLEGWGKPTQFTWNTSLGEGI